MSVLYVAFALILVGIGAALAIEAVEDADADKSDGPDRSGESDEGPSMVMPWLFFIAALVLEWVALHSLVLFAVVAPVTVLGGWRIARTAHNRRLRRQQPRPVQPGPWPISRSAWAPVLIGVDAASGEPVSLELPGNAILVAGLRGMGKSNLAQMLAAVAAHDPQCRLFAFDGKEGVELRPWANFSERFTTDPGEACEALRFVQGEMEERFRALAAHPRIKRVIVEEDGFPLICVLVDELARFTMDSPEHGDEFNDLLSDLIRRGRIAAVTVIAMTQRVSSAVISTQVSGNVGTTLAFRLRDPTSTVTTFGHGHPPAHLLPREPGLCYLATDSGHCQMVRCHFLSDEELEALSGVAAGAQRTA